MKLSSLYEVISPSDSFSLSRVIIVGPYPTKDFFVDLSQLEPSRIELYVDDGCSEDCINEIREKVRQNNCIFSCDRVAPISGNGLVHSKIYFFEWVNSQGNRTKRRIVVGSANASQQGFGLHAETYVSADLPIKLSNLVLKYFQDLNNCYLSETEELELPFDNGVTIWFPRMKKVRKISSFDAWLRRGRLCHKFDPDQSFAKLTLNLKKPLPSGVMDGIFSEYGFKKESESKVFNRAYIPHDDEATSDNIKWRGTYFIETNYGHWTSSVCYSNEKKDFISISYFERENVINQVQNADKDQKDLWIKEFLQVIDKIKENINNSGYEVNEYLYINKNGCLNRREYRKSALKKLNNDSLKADDSIFVDRYISGFSFPRVPQMGDEFDDFAISFCDSVLNNKKPKTPNRIVRAFREILKDRPYIDSGKELLDYIRSEWNNIEDKVINFYK